MRVSARIALVTISKDRNDQGRTDPGSSQRAEGQALLKPLVLPPLARPDGMTTHDYAFHRLRQAIMVGAFRPGTSVTIRGLAEALESSPTPVREALRQLTSIGALQFLENRRIVVPHITPARFEELISLRIALESHAARRAVAHLSERQIEKDHGDR